MQALTCMLYGHLRYWLHKRYLKIITFQRHSNSEASSVTVPALASSCRLNNLSLEQKEAHIFDPAFVPLVKLLLPTF